MSDNTKRTTSDDGFLQWRQNEEDRIGGGRIRWTADPPPEGYYWVQIPHKGNAMCYAYLLNDKRWLLFVNNKCVVREPLEALEKKYAASGGLKFFRIEEPPLPERCYTEHEEKEENDE